MKYIYKLISIFLISILVSTVAIATIGTTKQEVNQGTILIDNNAKPVVPTLGIDYTCIDTTISTNVIPPNDIPIPVKDNILSDKTQNNQTNSQIKVNSGYTSAEITAIRDNVSIERSSTPKLCSNGKVPKNIVNKKSATVNIIKGNPLNAELKGKPISKETILNISRSNKQPSITQSSYTYGAWYDWVNSYPSTVIVPNTGVYAIMTQHNPNIDSTYGIHSLGEIGTMGWDGDYVETGWIKNKGDVTRLFTFWWKDNNPKCYNSGCAGWVQYSGSYYPGMPISVDNIGTSYMIEYWSGNWWVWYKNQWIGYYPGTIWGSSTDFTYAVIPWYYGEVANSASRTTTDMGNGLFASNPNSAKLLSQEFMISGTWFYNAGFVAPSSPSLYSGAQPSTCWWIFCTPRLYDMRYGGPGTG